MGVALSFFLTWVLMFGRWFQAALSRDNELLPPCCSGEPVLEAAVSAVDTDVAGWALAEARSPRRVKRRQRSSSTKIQEHLVRSNCGGSSIENLHVPFMHGVD